jgi:filamentous hemagglutinin family protein
MENNIARNLLVGTALQTSLALVLTLPAHAQPAPNARPTGGVVIAGSASINQSANNTAVNQSSQRAAVNWQSFNVGSQQSVTFHQPSASAVTLNRVVGPDPSQIAGHIDANGQVVLINQSGVTFYKGAQVNTNGLMVSAIGMSNKAVQGFMASGKVVLDKAGNPNAAVVNEGNITVKQAGLAALVAPQVANHGTITAALGHVVLAGAKTATLDLYGDGLLSLDVTNQVTQVPVGKDGKAVAALVTNTGTIIADGGTVQLTARAADGIVQNLVDAGGTIRTASMGEHTGTIALNGMGGSIIVEGQLSAVGTKSATTGGAIEVATDGNVGIASTGRIDTSGKAGGGTVAIGTTLARAKGGPSVASTLTAKNVVVAKGATIKANAIDKGDGGRITVLSDSRTQIDGQISATGGVNGGNGGYVETSGETLGVTVPVDLSAPHGKVGTWLLDPIFLDVVNAEGGTEDFNFLFVNNNTIFAGDTLTGNPDTLTNFVLNQATADVVLQALKTLTVDANINLTQPGQTLLLEAGGTLTVSPGIIVSAPGDVTLATGGAAPAKSPFGTPPPPAAQPSPLISIGGVVTSTGGTVNLLSGTNGKIIIGNAGSVAAGGIVLNSGAGGITLTGNAAIGNAIITLPANAAADAAANTLDITSAGPVGQAASSTIMANLLSSSGGITGTVNLAGTKNAIATLGDIAATNFSLSNTGNLAVNGKVTATTSAGLSTTGLLTINGQVSSDTVALSANNIAVPGSLAAGTLAVLATNNFNETGAMSVGTLLAEVGGAVTLTGANQISTILDITAANITVHDNADLLISEALDANNITILDPGHQITLGDGAEILTGGSVRPGGAIQPALEPANGAPGAYLQAANFVQVGTSFVLDQTSDPNTLQISTTGNIQFDTHSGL